MWAYTGNASLGGAADWGLENKVGFHSAEGRIQESKPRGVRRAIKQEGRVRGHLWGGRKSASSMLGQKNRGHVHPTPGTVASLQPLSRILFNPSREKGYGPLGVCLPAVLPLSQVLGVPLSFFECP